MSETPVEYPKVPAATYKTSFKGCNVGNVVAGKAGRVAMANNVGEELGEAAVNIAKDLFIGGVRVSERIAKEFKEKTDLACKYQDIRINHPEIEKVCEENLIRTGIGVFPIEKKRVTPEVKDEWVRSEGHKFSTAVTEDELEEYRPDLNISTCCFVKKLNVNDFCKFSLTTKII